MTVHEFKHARRKIEKERFVATAETTFDIAIERTYFDEKRAHRIIELANDLALPKFAVVRGIEERKVARVQHARLRLQSIKNSAHRLPHYRGDTYVTPAANPAQFA